MIELKRFVISGSITINLSLFHFLGVVWFVMMSYAALPHIVAQHLFLRGVSLGDPEATLSNTLSLHHKKVSVVGKADGRIAQIIADYLRVKLLHSNLEFSFETVFFP